MALFPIELYKNDVLTLIYLIASTFFTECHDNCIGNSMDNMEMQLINCIISTFRSEFMKRPTNTHASTHRHEHTHTHGGRHTQT